MTDELETRLKRLQRQNLFLGVLALASVAVLGLVQLRASRHLRVVSEDGKSELQLEPEALTFLHEGKIVLVLKATETLTGLVGTDRNRTADFIVSPDGLAFRTGERPTVNVVAQGEEQTRGFSLTDDDGRLRAILSLSKSGAPLLRLAGKSPDVVSDLNINEEDEQRLNFTRGDGKPAVAVANGTGWVGCSALLPHSRASVRLEPNGEPELVLEDAAGHLRVLSAVP